MLLSPSKKSPNTAFVNGQLVTVNSKETLLQAALRQGIDFPHGCRVGGCASCKCKLISGNVKELTETTYILSDQELDQGYILACQSVPLSDLRIEVDLTHQMSRQRVNGRVIGQDKLTHDITRLRVQLDRPLLYKSGQFADISIGSMPAHKRSYSFAAPVQASGEVSFFVRKVAGGAFSSLINEQDVIGQTMVVDGPAGDFWLRPAEAPLLLIAGGSGLAPVLALLKDAAAKGLTRSATLLFGARTEADLYALDEIDAIARSWQGLFRFIPVLSEADLEHSWSGEIGLVANFIAPNLAPGTHAYLCGPAAMIDNAVHLLQQHGVAPAHIHADRFLAQKNVPKDLPKPTRTAGVSDYLKYFLFHAVGLASAAVMMAGGAYVTVGLLAVLLFYIVGDAVAGDDTSAPTFTRPGILTAQLWMALPLLMLIVFVALWSVSPGDPFGFGAWIAQLSGHDVIASRDATSLSSHAAALILTGLIIGMVGTITAHELTHRTWDPISMLIGRWLLAFSFDTVFSIEHVYGHHRYVSTEHDPATAPRGRNVYHHVVASTIKSNISAWKIEKRRLTRKGLAVISMHNAVVRGYLMSIFLVTVAWWIGGPLATVFFMLCALWGKALLEIVNYMEHYGMVRDPLTPVQPHHSWNTNKRISSWSMVNLTRHSHHHAQGEVPFHELKPFPDAPMMINGYLTTILITLIPPLWHRLMTPKVLAWDRDYATVEERELAKRANARSGIRALQQANAQPT